MATAPIRLNTREEGDRLLSNQPVLSSQGLGWSSLELEYRRLDATGFNECTLPSHLITFACKAERTPLLVRCSGGKEWRDPGPIGSAIIVPANFGYGQWWDVELEALSLFVSPYDLATAIDETASPEQIDILPQFSQPDPLLYQLALGLKSVVEAGGEGSRLYAETLTQTLMVHLLQHYTTRHVAPKIYQDGLSSAKLQLVLDYIQSHLSQDLGLKELAGLVQLSPHYFAHLFKKSMGIAPHQYVLQQRVKQAKQFLKQRELSIAAIAYEVGFANQAHLNRHFKRIVGVPPGVFRRG